MARRTASLDSKKEHSSVVMSMGPGASFLGVGRGGRGLCCLCFPQDTALCLSTLMHKEYFKHTFWGPTSGQQ